jgi:hypothetical protein
MVQVVEQELMKSLIGNGLNRPVAGVNGIKRIKQLMN